MVMVARRTYDLDISPNYFIFYFFRKAVLLFMLACIFKR